MNSSQILTCIIWYHERNELVSQQNGRASYTNNIVYLIYKYFVAAADVDEKRQFDLYINNNNAQHSKR